MSLSIIQLNYELFQHNMFCPQKDIYLVNMTKELDSYFSQLTLRGIEKYLQQNKKICILVNKKGYSNGLMCLDCGHVPMCKKCSVSISYHKISSGETIGLCHICKTQYSLPNSCDVCKSSNIKEYGIGTQKVAEKIQAEFGASSLIVESEKANSLPKIQKIFEEIPNYNVVVGTSLLTTPIKNYKFDLIIFLNADLGLNIPDYTSAEKNFYFLYETFLKHQTSNFIVQSFDPGQYSIRSACKLSKDEFHTFDDEFRQKNYYPPFADLCVLLYKNEIEERLFNKVDKLYKELLYLKEKYQMGQLEIYSTPPLIYKMFGKYRYNIILKGEGLRDFMDIVFTRLDLMKKGFKVDREAESIV